MEEAVDDVLGALMMTVNGVCGEGVCGESVCGVCDDVGCPPPLVLGGVFPPGDVGEILWGVMSMPYGWVIEDRGGEVLLGLISGTLAGEINVKELLLGELLMDESWDEGNSVSPGSVFKVSPIFAEFRLFISRLRTSVESKEKETLRFFLSFSPVSVLLSPLTSILLQLKLMLLQALLGLVLLLLVGSDGFLLFLLS